MLPKFSSDSKGQALVEFALILVVLLLFIFIIIESGRLFQGYLTVQNAARAAGRYAMTGQFDTACLFETPPCLDARLTSIKREARRSAGGLAIDDLAIAGETNSFVTEVWSYDDEGNWRQDEVGGPGDPIDIIARFQMPVVTPLLKPFADSVRLTGRVKVVAENYDQVGLTEGATAPPAPGNPGGGEPPEADLAIVKTASEEVVLAGTAVDYTITITNAGPFDAEAGITVVDTLPPGSFFTGYVAGARPVTCTEDPTNTITCAMPWLDKDPTNLNNKATVTLQTLAPATSGLITNTATVYPGPSTVDPNLVNNTTTANVTVRNLWADLSVTIVDDPDPVRETAFLTYTLEVNNLNYEDATGVVLSATLPAETTYISNSAGCNYLGGVVSCTVGSLNEGAVYSVDILVTANDDDDFLLPRIVTINASVLGNEFDPDLENNKADETTSVADIWADLAITKLGPVEPVVVDTPFTYVLQVTNLGPDAVFTSTITDTLPVGMVFTGVYTPGIGSSGVSCSGAGGTVVTCDMSGLSSLDQDIGEPISKEVTIQVVADEPMDRFNTATVSGNLFDPNTFNNTDQVETLVGQADLIINKYGPLAIDAEQPITYTIVVTNAGPMQATGVQIVDDLPTNLTNVSVLPAMVCQSTGASQYTCNVPDLDAGEVFTVTVSGIAPDQDFIVNRASTSHDFPDLNEADNTAVFTTTTTLIADLEVTKRATNDYNPGAGEALAGEELRYFIQLGSLGPSPASGLILTDTLPPSVEFASAAPQPECGYDSLAHQVVCDMGSLVLGPTVNVQINVTPTLAGLITNTVVFAGAQPDPDPSNNFAFAVVDVQPADLQLQKFATPSVLVGDAITYTLVISNAGPSDALNVVITDTLPVSVTTPIAIQSALASCDGATNPVICTLSELAVNDTATITMTVLATGDGLATNVAAATAQDAIEVDLATASTLINPVTDLAIDKTASGSFYAGEPLTYTLTITNYGPSIARSVRVTDTLPAGATYQSATTPGGACSESSGLVSCVINVIPIAGTETITIGTEAGLEGDYINTADVGSDAFDPDPTNNSVSVTTPILPAADLGIEKNHSGQFFAGEIFAYTLDVTNGGPSTAQSVIVTDSLPLDVVFVSASPSAPTCEYFGGAHQVVCQLGDLGSGLSTGATIQVTTNITGAHVNQAETASATTDLYQANNTTTLTTTIQPVADLRLAKGNVTVDTVAGQQHTYAISVTNDGPNVATNVTVTDTLPAGMTYVSATVPCTPSGQTVVCDLGGLAVGATTTLEITVDVDASLADGEVLTNEATVSAAEADRDSADNTDTVDTLVVRRADMTIAKLDTGSPATAGAIYNYTIVVTNIGPSDASFVQVVDTLPGLTTYASSSISCADGGATVTCTIPTIASGDAFTFTLAVDLDPSLVAGANILNSVTVAAVETDPDGGNNSADVLTPVARLADLRLDKSDDGSPAVVGEEYTYTLVVTNDGPSDASSVSIDDTLPANTSFVAGTAPYCSGSGTDVICDIGDLPFSNSVTVTITMLVEATAVHGSIVENTATVSGAEPDPDFAPPSLGNNYDNEFTTIVGKADVGISKSDADVTAIAGGQFVYEITVDNAGPSEATGVVVTDTLPGPMTYLGSTDTCGLSGGQVVCSPGNVASGASTSFSITVTVAASASDGVTVTNTADVSAQQVDRNQANNSASDDSLIEHQSDLEIEKDDGSLSAVAGQPFEYTLTVTNNGPSDASGVVVTDTLPADTVLVGSSGGICTDTGGGDLTCSVGILPATQSAVFTVSVYVESYVTEPTNLVNVAGVYGNQIDPASGNNRATTSTPVVRSADVAVVKSDMGVHAIVGELYTYTLDVSNNGPSNASAVILTDTIPVSSTYVSATSSCTYGSGIVTCAVGDLASGAGDTFTVTIRVDGDVPHGSFIVNTAGVDANESDPDQINNASSVTTEVVGKADLSIDKSDDGSNVRAGDTYTYTVSVTNLGPSQANNVVITDTLPAHSSFVRATGATCSDSSISVCEFAVLSSGTTNVFSITVRFATSAPHNTVVTNTVQVSAEEADLATANNRDEEPTLIVRESDVFVAKADNDLPAVAGENYVYTITVGTLGPSDATGVVLTDTLPLYTSATSVPAECSDFGSYVRCDLDTLLADDSPNDLLFTLLVNQAAPAGVAITNTVDITTSEADPNLGNNQAEEATVIERVADLAVQKSDLGNTPVAGQPFSYTIAVSNNGPSIASSIEITDTLPPSVTLNGPTPLCTQTGVDVACPLAAALAAGQSTTLTMTVLIGGDIDHGTTIDNIAGVRSAETDPDLSDNVSTVSSLVLGNADLAITKVGQDPPPVAGLAYTYTITVTNNGPSEATGVTVVDTLPVSTTFAGSTDSCTGAGRNYTCDVGFLASGDSQSFEISVTVDSAVDVDTPLTNVASVSGDQADLNSTNNSATAAPLVERQVNLLIDKSDDGSPAIAGQQYTFTVVVTNTGPSDAAGVQVTDELPAGTTYAGATASCSENTPGIFSCNLGTLAAGDEASFDINVDVPAGSPDGEVITNTVSVASVEVVSGPQDQEQATVQRIADLAVAKSDDGGPAIVGNNHTYTITVSNNGPSDASGIVITDTLPVSTTFVSSLPAGCLEIDASTIRCAMPDLIDGASANVQLTVEISATVANGATIENGVEVNGTEFDDDTANDTANLSTNVIREIDLSLTKTGEGGNAVAGEAYTYTIQVTNNDALVSAAGIVITDTLPLSTTFGSASGASCAPNDRIVVCTMPELTASTSTPIDITVNVSPSAGQGAVLTNTAEVTGDVVDPDMGNNDDQVTTTVDRSTDLQITKTGEVGDAVAGQSYDYSIVVRNDGPSDASGVVFTDTLPISTSLQTPLPGGCSLSAEGTICSIGTLPAGDELTFNLTIDVDSAVFSGTLLTNSVTVGGNEDDPVVGNDTATDEANVVNQADLSISKFASSDTAYAGETLTYTLIITNNGPSIATGVTVTDTYPAGLDVDSAVTSSGTCSIAATIICDLVDLDDGDSATVTIVGTLLVSGTLTNSAVVGGDVIDTNPGNDSDSVDITSLPAADVRAFITEGVISIATATTPFTVTVQVNNYGPTLAQGAVFTETFAVGNNAFEFISASHLGCGRNGPQAQITCDLGDLSPGASFTVDLLVRFTNSSVGLLVDHNVIISSATYDPNPTNNDSAGYIDIG